MEAVRLCPVIFDKKLPDFKEFRQKDNAWEEVNKELRYKGGIGELKMKYKFQRTRSSPYLASIKRVSGMGAADMPLDKEFESLRWPVSHISHRFTVTN